MSYSLTDRLKKLIEAYDVLDETNGCVCDVEGDEACKVCELGGVINSIGEEIDNELRHFNIV